MARTVALAQRSSEPLWFEIGKRTLLQTSGQTVNNSDAVNDASINVRTAQRFARIAAFVQASYPRYFSGELSLGAGSAAMLEFIKIHQLSEQSAARIAEKCLAGAMSVGSLRTQLAVLQAAKAPALGTGRKSSSQWQASFERLAVRRIRSDHLLEDAEKIDRVERPRHRSALEPDFVVHYPSSDRWVAVDLKAPRDTAARSVANVAAGLVSRVAVLRLRYDDAVLVLPNQASEIAKATIELWTDWAGPAEFNPKKLQLLVIGEDTHTWLSSP